MQFITHTSTKADGNMSLKYGEQREVLQNRRRFLKTYHLPTERAILMDSRHKDQICIIDDTYSFDSEPEPLADTLITQLPNTPLLVTTADCLPITLFDPVTHTLALIHLSRHTFCLDLIEKTFTVLTKRAGVKPHNVTVVIGPHIHKASYSFPAPLSSVHPKLAPYIEELGGNVHIDLESGARETLRKHHVQHDMIQISPTDTYANDHYFSHVRETTTGEQKGRLLTVACWLE